jgi:hypothetical protein
MNNPAEFSEIEPESETERHNDVIMTALRTSAGLNPSLLTPKELTYAHKVLQPTSSGNLRIAESDWLRSNTITLPLLR